MFKRLLAIFLIASVFVFSVSAKEVEKPEITSKAYVLYNPDNDEVVESVNGKEKMYPASLTKMLTALVVYELCDNLEEVITVSENAVKSIYGTSSSKADLKIGEEVSVKQMLYLLLLPSGNDAANALAEHFGSNNKNFVIEMNRKAKEIGMNNSHFVNPHGLHDSEHYTTAEDLAILADAFSDVELLREISETNQFIMPQTNKQGERVINTTNFLKIEKSGYYYPYAKGLKTGNTDEAGRCLAASAEKDGKRFIAVLLDCPEKWYGKSFWRCEFLEAAKIFDYAFENYEMVKIAKKGTIVGKNTVFQTYNKKAEIVLANDVFATLKKGTDISELKITYTLNNLNSKSQFAKDIAAGETVGNAKLFLKGKMLGQSKLLSNNSVQAHWWIKFWDKADIYFYVTVSVIAFIISLFFALIIRKYVVIYKRKKAKQKRLERRRRLQIEFDSKPEYNYYKFD